MPQHGPQEIEIKLALPDEDAYLRLRRILAPALGAVAQENRFFDGSKAELSSRKAVLRLRREVKVEPAAVEAGGSEPAGALGGSLSSGAGAGGGLHAAGRPRFFLTLKTKGEIQGSIHRRGEVESLLPAAAGSLPEGPDALLALDVDPIRALRTLAPDLTGLRDQGGFRNLRELYRPQARVGPLQEALWELDRTEFPGGAVEFELELEIPAADASEALGREAEEGLKALLGRWGIPSAPQPHSKYSRYLQYRSAEGAG